MQVARRNLWAISLFLFTLMLLFPPVVGWEKVDQHYIPFGYRFIGTLSLTPSISMDVLRLLLQVGSLLMVTLCLDWLLCTRTSQPPLPQRGWLIGTRNVLMLLFGIEILLGVWILIADPNFAEFHATFSMVRYAVFNTWAFLFDYMHAPNFSLIVFSLLLDFTLITALWRFPRQKAPFMFASLYFLARLGMGLYSIQETPLCACPSGYLAGMLLKGGALSNILFLGISGIGFTTAQLFKRQSITVEEKMIPDEESEGSSEPHSDV